ncbi:hypothetical protein AMECASPLE_012066 [Ameca splendens]|uniref:Uncharacterized protein n=1 Tax=Ameca splendens TaxID=208324 RepID=A0ABV0YNH9_9TELE
MVFLCLHRCVASPPPLTLSSKHHLAEKMILCIFSPPSALFRFQLNISVFSCLCPQVKFNQALADHSMSDKPRLIDGIVLTKFDTIDDKVDVLFLLVTPLRMYLNVSYTFALGN